MPSQLVVALIAPEGDDRRQSARELARCLPLELDQFTTLGEFRRRCAGKRYHGVAVAPGALEPVEEDEKLFLVHVAQSFPLLWLHAVAEGEGAAGAIAGEKLRGAALFDRFGVLCRKSGPRGVRLEARRQCALCASVSFGDPGSTEKGCIVNLSASGFFVALAHDRVGPKVEVSVEALADRRPISCEVRWHQPWGPDARTLPGFGVHFLEIAEEQRSALAALVEFSAFE